MAFCFSIPAVLFQHHLSPFDFTLRYFGHLPFVFLRRSVLILLLCPRFVAFSLIFPLALSFFQRNMSIFISIRLFKGGDMTSSSFSSPAKVVFGTNCKQKLLVKLIFSAQNEISGENFSRAEEKNTPQRWFTPKCRIGRKGGFGGESQGGDEAKKTDLTTDLPCYEVSK